MAGVYEDKRKQVLFGDRVSLIRISNALELSFPPYSELLSSVPRFVVGTGLRARPATSNPVVNKQLNIEFRDWAISRFCDVECIRNFYEFQKWIIKRMVAEGEVYVLLTKTADGYPQLQYISPLRVRKSADSNDNSIDGIYYSRSGAITAFNIFDLEDPGDGATITTTDTSYTKVPAENVIWLSREEQGHGIPWGQSAFNDIRDLKEALDAVANAVNNAGMLTIQYSDPTGKGGPMMIDGMAGKLTKQGGNPSAAANPTGSNLPLTQGNPNGMIDINNPASLERIVNGTKNKIVNTGYGKLEPINANIPDIKDYTETKLRLVCQAVGISYEFAYCPEKLQNKGGDIILDKTRAYNRDVQELAISRFCQRVYNWVISVLASDELFLELGSENPYICHWSTPAKVGAGRNDTNNRINGIQNHIWNPYLDAEEQGRDAEEIADGQVKYIKYWNEKCKAEGIDPNGMTFGIATAFKPLASSTSTTVTTQGNIVATITKQGDIENDVDGTELLDDHEDDDNEDIDQNDTNSTET